MTKSITITYNEADESFLMTLFNRFKIKIEPTTSHSPLFEEKPVLSKVVFLNDLKEAVEEMQAHQRGEIELQYIDSFIAELEEESVNV